MEKEKNYTSVDIMLAILFTAGLVILGFALYFEAITGAPFYVILGSIAGGLTIAATFIAAIRKP